MAANRIGLRRRVSAKAPWQTITFCDSSTSGGVVGILTARGLVEVPYTRDESVAEVAKRVGEAVAGSTVNGATVTFPRVETGPRVKARKAGKRGR